jgi:enoyl-CoA hydratase/carnithine racemase
MLVQLHIEGDLAEVVLNRPKQHNGMNMALLRDILKVAKSLQKRTDIRAVLLRGEGPSFCSGLDIKAVISNPLTAAGTYARLFSPCINDFQRWSLIWRDLPMPVIALVHGNCFGAGFQLALGADIRISTPDAQWSLMEAKWGLIPDMGGTVTLRELVRMDVAKELAMTARTFDGIEAHALGLVTHITKDPRQRALALIDDLRQRSPDAIAAAKALLQGAWVASETDALSSERYWQRQLLGHQNQRIAIERGMKKRDTPYARRSV